MQDEIATFAVDNTLKKYGYWNKRATENNLRRYISERYEQAMFQSGISWSM